jgi:dipeptidyl aminopeptidase/acylaminoacyl peptidase
MSLDEKQICSDCVGEAFLSARIEKEGKDGACSYCESTGKVFSLDEMANEIQIAFEEHFYLTASEASGLEYVMSKESDYDWEREGDRVVDVLENHVEISSEAADDLQRILEERTFDFEQAKMGYESPFGREAQYAERGVHDGESQAGWTQFERSLKTEARYFNRTGEDTLRSIFDGLAEHKSEDGRPIIVDAGPGLSLTAFYRARVFQSFAKLEAALKRPDIEVGPPPSGRTSDGLA